MSGIRYAWCVELNEVVSARDAKRAYFEADPKPAKFSFLCQHEACRAAKTRVTCVNYRDMAAETSQSVVVHFRELDQHIDGCRDGHSEDADPQAVDSVQRKKRQALLKCDDWIQVFDPNGESGKSGSLSPMGQGTQRSAEPGLSDGRSRTAASSGVAGGRSTTRFVEDLAALHVEAKADPLVASKLDDELAVVGYGRISLRNLLCHVGSAQVGGGICVYYGGATVKRYGQGFALNFMDKVAGLKLSTYVSAKVLSEYRHRKYLASLIEAAPSKRYVTAYVWGSIALGEKDGLASLSPQKLQHLAIVLGPNRPPDQ